VKFEILRCGTKLHLRDYPATVGDVLGSPSHHPSTPTVSSPLCDGEYELGIPFFR
jgi:hypothetical protein